MNKIVLLLHRDHILYHLNIINGSVKKLEMLEKKLELFNISVSTWSKSFCYCTKEGSTREQPQKHLCMDYHTFNSLLPPVVKVHSKAQYVLFLVPPTKD